MAILNNGDYVIVEGEGIGKVTLYNFMEDYSLVWLLNNTCKFAVMRRKTELTLIDPVFAKLLTDVNK